MADINKSRREIVVGGLIAASVAVPAALARLNLDDVAAEPKPAIKPTKRKDERERWEGQVGQSFRILTDAGYLAATLSAVERVPFDPARPAELMRQMPFYAFFTVPLDGAPVGQQTYGVTGPDGSQSEMFFGRGEDKRRKATLYALFN